LNEMPSGFVSARPILIGAFLFLWQTAEDNFHQIISSC